MGAGSDVRLLCALVACLFRVLNFDRVVNHVMAIASLCGVASELWLVVRSTAHAITNSMDSSDTSVPAAAYDIEPTGGNRYAHFARCVHQVR